MRIESLYLGQLSSEGRSDESQMRIERFKILGRDYGIPEEDESQMRIESFVLYQVKDLFPIFDESQMRIESFPSQEPYFPR